MSKYLNHNATLQCTHGGQVMMIPPPMRSLYIVESPVVTDVDLYEAMIIGCPQIGPGIKPCLKIIEILMGEAIQIEVDGETPILSSLEAMTDGVPPGMVSAITDGGSNAEPAPFSIMAMTMSAASAIGAALCHPCVSTSGNADAAAVAAAGLASTGTGSPSTSPADEMEAKRKRLLERQRLISKTRSGTGSTNPTLLKAARRLEMNSTAVDLARLSDNTYSQDFSGNVPPAKGAPPPPPWQEMSTDELQAKGIDPALLQDSRAVVYQIPPAANWPGGPKTVIAFRGTQDGQDATTDYDNAMNGETSQYKAAVMLGTEARMALGPDVLVTGHSLGGGKAQAAGAAGGFNGMMFNSAGLNPASVDGALPATSQFEQYRTTGDPLTGLQNSPITQGAVGAVVGLPLMALGAGMKAGFAIGGALGAPVTEEQRKMADRAFYGLPDMVKNAYKTGQALPPAIGTIHEVPALDSNGKPISRLNARGQHSAGNLINGIEQQKQQDVAALRAGNQ
jgi:hypothetical protein